MVRFSSFRDFYPYYLGEHSNPVCRRLHLAGTTLALLALALGLLTRRLALLLVVPVVGYGFAWIGHYVFERNRPATFRYPLYSLLGDLAMLRDVLLRRIPLVLLLSVGIAAAAPAQRGELLGGAGATFSGPSLRNETPNLMAGAVVQIAPRFGVRGDALYTVDEEEDLVGMSGDAVYTFTPPGAGVRPSVMAGGSVFVSGGGDAEFALNGGLGLRFTAGCVLGFFIEGRYFRFPSTDSLYDEMIFTVLGISVALP